MIKLQNLKDPTPEEIKYIQKYGCCTGWEVTNKYGITSACISRAIKNNKIKAVKKSDGISVHSRNYIVRDAQFDEFVGKYKKTDNPEIILSAHWKKD